MAKKIISFKIILPPHKQVVNQNTMKDITIIDAAYKQWLKTLAVRYRKSQIKAAVKVNTEQILFNLSLGKDIAERQEENKYGSQFYATLSKDLKEEIPGVVGLSESNIRYCKRFYLLYSEVIENLPQVVEDFVTVILPQVEAKFLNTSWKNSIPKKSKVLSLPSKKLKMN